MAVITSEYDITIKLGSSFEETFEMGFDITLWTIQAQCRQKQKLSATLVCDFTITVVDALLGIFKMSLTSAQTSAIVRSRKCFYDVLLTTPSDSLDEYYIKGVANLEQSVTVKAP